MAAIPLAGAQGKTLEAGNVTRPTSSTVPSTIPSSFTVTEPVRSTDIAEKLFISLGDGSVPLLLSGNHKEIRAEGEEEEEKKSVSVYIHCNSANDKGSFIL